MSATTGVNERLAALTAAGTSVWLDQMRRSLVEGGELQRMVEEDSLRGVTSNPAIFEKAILGSSDYDDQLEECAREGLDGRETYRHLVVRDVQGACRLADDVQRRVGAEPALDGQDPRQCLARHQLHHEEGELVLLAVVVHLGDAAVLQRRGEPRLGAEPHPEALVGDVLLLEHLDRDRPAEELVGRLPDLAHATGGQTLVKAVSVAENEGSAHDWPTARTMSRAIGAALCAPSVLVLPSVTTANAIFGLC